MSKLFVGVDAGGTHTRAVIATAEGRVVGTGKAGGANHWSSGNPVAGTVSEAVARALGDSDPSRVANGVVAVAGAGATDPGIGDEISSAWANLGLRCRPNLIPDVVAALASGTSSAEGLAVVAGTGSVAALISDLGVIRRSGGHGWLLGDEGSAVRLGIEGLTAVLRALDGRGPDTSLVGSLPPLLGIHDPDPVATQGKVVSTAYGRPPSRLGELAPTVVRVAAEGDPVASGIIQRAVRSIVDMARAAAGPATPPVVVLAGSLLTGAEEVHGPVVAHLRDLWADTEIREIDGGVAGATLMAIRRDPDHPDPAAVLRTLTDALT